MLEEEKWTFQLLTKYNVKTKKDNVAKVIEEGRCLKCKIAGLYLDVDDHIVKTMESF